MLRARTFVAKEGDISRQWHVMNAEGEILGRIATQAAVFLRGKHKPLFTPHVDCGDEVVIVNAQKIRVTGNKLDTKIYKRYSGYPSGLKEEPLRCLLVRRPTEALRRAVVGMLPKGPLGRKAAKRLRIYAGPEHPHSAQVSS